MTREARAVFLGILTLIAYAVFIFVDQGSFIFPFPLNEFIFLIISAQFLWWNKRTHLWAGVLSIAAGITAVLSTQFFWTFIYGPENMMHFMEGLTTDRFTLVFYVLVLTGAIATMVQQKRGIALVFSGLFLVAFIAGVILNNLTLFLLGYGLMVASIQITKAFAPYHLLWVLLFVLKLTEWLTFSLNS